MLQKIRDTQGLGRKIFIAFIIAVFALWGVETIVGTILTNDTAVVVNGEKISEQQVENSYQQQYQLMLQNLGPDGDPALIDEDLLREVSLNELIQRELLRQVAEGNRLAVSSRTIDRMVASTEAFQINGVFSEEMAQTMLANAGFTPTSYRAALAEDERLNQIISAYAGSGFVTESEVQRFAELAGQNRDVRFLVLDYFDQSMQVAVTDEEISAYYDTHQDEFIREERVAVDYLLLSRIDLMEQVEVSEEDVLARYEQESDAFQSQIERRASHILFEAGSEDIDAALARANAARQRLDAGDSFEDLAAELSDDTGSADYGGDVGYTTGDSFVEPFENALKELEIGQISEPVVSEFGVHLIMLTDLISGEFASLDDSRERILREISLDAATSLYREKLDQLEILAYESFDLELPSEELGLPVLATEPFTRVSGSGLAANQLFADAAFSEEVLLEDLNSDPVELDEDTTVVLHLKEHLLPEVRPLTEVRVQIELLLRQEKVREQARSTGESLLSSLQDEQNIDTMLEQLGLEWQEFERLGRGSDGVNPELTEWLFTLEAPAEGDTTSAGRLMANGTYVVAQLRSVTAGRLEDMPASERESFVAYVSQQSGVEDRASMMAHLQTTASIRR